MSRYTYIDRVVLCFQIATISDHALHLPTFFLSWSCKFHSSPYQDTQHHHYSFISIPCYLITFQGKWCRHIFSMNSLGLPHSSLSQFPWKNNLITTTLNTKDAPCSSIGCDSRNEESLYMLGFTIIISDTHLMEAERLFSAGWYYIEHLHILLGKVKLLSLFRFYTSLVCTIW